MKKLIFLLFIPLVFACSDDANKKKFNEHSTIPNVLDVKNYIFIQNVFTYGLNNQQTNSVTLILIPDNHKEPTKYKFITLRKSNKVQEVLNTLKKENVFDNNDFSKIKEWLDSQTWRMTSAQEILNNEEKKLNLDLENKVINSIVLKYNENLPNILFNKKIQELNELQKKIDKSLTPDSVRRRFEKLKD